MSPAAIAKIYPHPLQSGALNNNDEMLFETDHNRPTVPSFDKNISGIELPACENKGESLHEGKISRNAPLKQKFNTFKVILSGAPASGKGTQCEEIKKNFGLVHLSSGDILRGAVQQGTVLGLRAKPYMDAGHLVPDHLVIELIINRLKDHDCETRGWLLDGFPRTESQAEALREAGIIPDVFLMLDVPEDLLVERVAGRRTDPVTGLIYHMKYNPPEAEEVAFRLIQRSDDTAEKIIVRYREFQNHTDAIKTFYEDKMVRIDGAIAPALVSASIITKLDEAILSKRERQPDTENHREAAKEALKEDSIPLNALFPSESMKSETEASLLVDVEGLITV